MLIVQIRQAERALKDGRLDEAFELARDEEVRAHRRGQDLIGRLVRALANRGQDHLSAGRFSEASADCDKAGQLGGNLPDTAALRAAITEAVQAREQARRRRADAAAAAREHIDNGRLSIGQQLLADVQTPESHGHALRGEAKARRARAEAALARVVSALERDDWASAIDALLEARQAHDANSQLPDLVNRVVGLVIQQSREAIDQGRLDLAESMMQRLEPLASKAIEVHELERFIDQCRSASACIDRGELRRAAEILRRLASIRPATTWVTDLLSHVQRAADSLEHAHGGPLGLLANARTRIGDPEPDPRVAPTMPLRPSADPDRHDDTTAVPRRFMIQVDAVGSFLVLRDRRITIGPARSSRHPDVSLLADAGLPATTIERNDEDYFLTCDTPVRVNGAPVTHKLLAGGDRIALSPRCRMKFAVPNAASTSAVIDLAGTRLPRGDARRVILLDESIIVGPGPKAHVRADTLDAPAVLHLRGDRLFLHARTEVMVNDQPADRHTGIPMNAHVKIGPLSMVITEV